MIIQKDNKLINSLSSDNEELHLKKIISLTKKKKTAHAYFWAPSFGGKIRHIWTEVTYRINKEHASKDLVFLAGKFLVERRLSLIIIFRRLNLGFLAPTWNSIRGWSIMEIHLSACKKMESKPWINQM